MRPLAFLACLLGASGVAAAAASAHAAGGDPRLSAAALILLSHAAAILALSGGDGSRLRQGAAALMGIGAALFAADMAARTFAGRAAFPMAAPAGGILLIAGWIVGALAFAIPR